MLDQNRETGLYFLLKKWPQRVSVGLPYLAQRIFGPNLGSILRLGEVDLQDKANDFIPHHFKQLLAGQPIAHFPDLILTADAPHNDALSDEGSGNAEQS